MVMLDVKIEGLKELSVNVDQLKASFSRTTLRTALRNAQSLFVHAPRPALPSTRETYAGISNPRPRSRGTAPGMLT